MRAALATWIGIGALAIAALGQPSSNWQNDCISISAGYHVLHSTQCCQQYSQLVEPIMVYDGYGSGIQEVQLVMYVPPGNGQYCTILLSVKNVTSDPPYAIYAHMFVRFEHYLPEIWGGGEPSKIGFLGNELFIRPAPVLPGPYEAGVAIMSDSPPWQVRLGGQLPPDWIPWEWNFHMPSGDLGWLPAFGNTFIEMSFQYPNLQPGQSVTLPPITFKLLCGSSAPSGPTSCHYDVGPPNAVPVQRLCQSDPSWTHVPLGEPCPNQSTIGLEGCVLTSATMIMNSMLGLNLTPPDVNVLNLDGDGAPDVFYNREPPANRKITNLVYWPYVAELMNRFPSVGGSFQPPEHITGSTLELEEKIRQLICNEKKYPVCVRVAEVARPDHQHTVVAYGVGDTSGTRIKIADPANRSSWGPDPPQWLDEYVTRGYTIQYLDVIRSGRRVSIVGSLDCPAELMITDAQGRRAGYDPNTALEVNEIPGVAYSTEWPDADDTDDPSPPPPQDRGIARKVAYIYPPLSDSALHFQITGTGEGTGSFSVVQFGGAPDPRFPVHETVLLSPGTQTTCDVPVPSACELDTDADGIVDCLDNCPYVPNPGQADCNGNGVGDACEIADGTAQDCNSNGVPDECDIASGTAQDCNHNGIPDECELCGDLNKSGTVDALDYWIMLAGFGRCAPDSRYVAAAAMDVNGNGCIDLVDYRAWFCCYKTYNGQAFVPPPPSPSPPKPPVKPPHAAPVQSPVHAAPVSLPEAPWQAGAL